MNTNKPAFPRDHRHDGHNGMDLLDYMATKAMQGMLAGHFACYGHDNYWKRDAIAEEAYEMAEAMMAEREKRARSQEPQNAVQAAFGGLVQTAQG
jgi:alpha-mannosidase